MGTLSRSRVATLLECREVHLLCIALKIVEEHPAPVQSLPVLADNNMSQIDAPIQAGQGEEVGLGDYQGQIDFAAAAQLDSPAKSLIPEHISPSAEAPG